MNFARFSCLSAMLLGIAVQARPFTEEEKRADFEQLASIIKSSYGPYELKKATLKLDVDQMVKDYAKEAAGASNAEFYHLINKFVAEFQDSHFRSTVQTDYVTSLGFVADRIEGKVLLDQINRAMLPESYFNFQRGDEIISIDGKPVADVVEGLAKYVGMGNKEAALRMATVLLGFRPAALAPTEKGFTTLEIRRGTSELIESIMLVWYTAGEPLEDRSGAETWDTPVPADYQKIMIDDVFTHFPKAEKAEQAFRCNGLTRTAVPKGATILMANPFVAYYHPTKKGNVGYLRIPHYWWGEKEDLRFQQYEWAIEQLEKNTVGLIIDQDHNCGGSVFFLEKMVGLFADKPFQGLQFEFLASRAEYLQFKSWIGGEARFTLAGEDWLGVVGAVKKAMMSRSKMSAKTSFHNNRMLSPNSVRYTKPILMLIDEMSGSGGDAFPAMMQGIGRATLMGTRTMGAGGHVAQAPTLNYSANQINLTKSLFYRPDGKPVENLGAEPTIKYQPTRDDFMYQYRGYQKRYLEELAKLIP